MGAIMNAVTAVSQSLRKRELLGRTVVVIGGSAGIGLEVGWMTNTALAGATYDIDGSHQFVDA